LRVCEALAGGSDAGAIALLAVSKSRNVHELIAQGEDDAGVTLAMEVVDDVVAGLDPIVRLALEVRNGGPLAVSRALRVCEALMLAAAAAVQEGGELRRRVG
jgi:hypothetical protein